MSLKSAEEWNKEVFFGEPVAPLFRQCQADALRHAAELARKLNDGHDWPISRILEAEAAQLTEP